MAPRVCFYGRAGTGSFEARARQIAACRPSWRAADALDPALLMEHDLFVCVKRFEPRKLALLRGLGKKVVLDLLDCWDQPADDLRVRDLASAQALFRGWGRLPADAVIWASQAMQRDLGPLFPAGPVIYHHWRPGLAPIPLRERPSRVGYEGDPAFLGPWRDVLQRACRELGLEFVVNPPSLTEVDLGVAVRGGEYSGWLSLRYKSNVKLANFYGAGLPALVQAGAEAYRETACPGLRAFSTPAELRAQLRALLPLAERQRLQAELLRAREDFTLERAAQAYEQLFASLAPGGG